jgi:protein-S-isoprenylcysteine O-methyltransferase Ste14
MSRVAVTGIFIVLTVGTGTAAMGAIYDAVTEGTVRAWTVAAYAALKLVVVAAFSFFVFVREPSRRPARDPLAFVACALAVAAVVMLKAPPASASTQLVVMGELITLAACAWLLVSVLALGRCFGVLPEVRGLVTAGPYSIVRHPVYLGELGAATGLVIAAPTIWNIGVAAVFAAAQAVRMRLEELALTREYPEYVAYAAETPRLIPRPRRRPA